MHLILGASEYAKIKVECAPRVGRPGEPVAERTKLGWTILSPGEEAEVSKALVTQTSQADYEGLCKMDVLGLPSWRPSTCTLGVQGTVEEEHRRLVRDRAALERRSSFQTTRMAVCADLELFCVNLRDPR